MLFIILLVTTLWLFYKYFTSSFDYWKKRGVDDIKPTFPFGNIFPLITMQKSYGDLLAQLYNSTTADVVGYWIFTMPYLLIRNPEHIKNILVKDFNQFNERATVGNKNDPVFNNMLFSMNFHDWRVIRRKLSPAFTTAKLKNMIYIFNEAADDLGEYLDGLSGNGIDCKIISSKFTANVFTGCGFGYKINCFKDTNCEFFKYAEGITEPTVANMIKLFATFIVPKFSETLKFHFLNKQAEEFFRSRFWKILREREASGDKHDDFIDIFIQLKNEGDLGDGIKLDDDMLFAQAILFYVAGYETTSSVISFALYELAMNETIQDKLRIEIVDALKQEDNGKFSYETIRNLAYLNKVMSESLRKYPTLPVLERQCVEDYKIPGTSIIIAKGTKCQMSPIGLHYDPVYYPNPDVFDPERFSPEAIQSRPSNVYLPFGDGPHNCIGKRIGLLTAKVCVAKILTKFCVEPTETTPTRIEIDPRVFLIKSTNVLLKFKKL